MLTPKSLILITSKTTGVVYEFDFVAEVEIKQTWQDFTDTAKITIPRKLNLEGKSITNGVDSLFKRGDSVQIWLGYLPTVYDPTVDPKTYLIKEFEGYVTKVKPQLPIEIECEDPMWLLKQFTMTQSFPELTKLQVVLDYISGKYKAWSLKHGYTRKLTFKAIDTAIGKLDIGDNAATPIDTFKRLKDHLRLSTFVRDDVVYCGFAWKDFNKVNNYHFDSDQDIITSDMEYRNRADVPVLIVAKMVYAGTKGRKVGDKASTLRAIAGDYGGDVLEIPYYGNFTKAQLQKFANDELDKISYDGFYGSLETFGEPSVNYWDRVTLSNGKISDQNGTYLVKQVDKTFGMTGFRQKIQLDIKI